MPHHRLRGLIAATATPVFEDLTPDAERLMAHCRRLLVEGCHGINLLGTTGEATSFNVAQRLAVMRAVAASGLPLQQFMVGTGAAAWQDAIQLTRAATELGFAGALLLPPFYYPGLDADALTDYVDRLVAQVDDRRLRLYLYHIPQNTQVPWPVHVVAALKRRHGELVVGLKDSGGDLAYARAVASTVPDFDVFPSAEGSIAQAATDGYAGCISATLNLTSAHARIAWDQAGTPAADPALAAARELRALMSRKALVSSVKAALARKYADASWARMCPPLQPLSAADADALTADMARVSARL